jgi:hypothetical protein
MALLTGQATYDEVALPHGEKFKSWDVDQPVLLPTSVHEVVPTGYVAHFVLELARPRWTCRQL